MTIYPAIDLLKGKAVRLTQGNFHKKTVYSDDPARVARQFAKHGAEYIHVVDLDGAKNKQPVNINAVRSIAESVNVPVQLGGGIRSPEIAEELLKYVSRIVIGTVAITEPYVLKSIIDRFGPDKVVVSVDYKSAEPAIDGWAEISDVSGPQIMQTLEGFGVKTVIVTDIDKDGLLSGPNIGLMKEWKQRNFEVICSGGVTTSADIADLKLANIDGAIIGKALYEKKISLKEALDASR
jgi:phosphoribosylformimino-5-aminoimidazole carboxamide ribotide isomerase